MDFKWVQIDFPRFLIYSVIKEEKRYVYYISSLENNKFSLHVIKFGDAKDVPAYQEIHDSIIDAKKYAEKHYLECILKKPV